MLDESAFRRESYDALESLKQVLIRTEERTPIFETEEKGGVLNVLFEDDDRFVFTPNTPVRQIWISALSTSYKLEWSEPEKAFILPKTGEKLQPLTERLLRERLSDPSITLC
ncbi:MAG: iron donor protein CyaY [Acidobacteriaceae bacterium]|nr:iron donor protein CyaY [Acidobacteriaceae bacterium]